MKSYASNFKLSTRIGRVGHRHSRGAEGGAESTALPSVRGCPWTWTGRAPTMAKNQNPALLADLNRKQLFAELRGPAPRDPKATKLPELIGGEGEAAAIRFGKRVQAGTEAAVSREFAQLLSGPPTKVVGTNQHGRSGGWWAEVLNTYERDGGSQLTAQSGDGGSRLSTSRLSGGGGGSCTGGSVRSESARQHSSQHALEAAKHADYDNRSAMHSAHSAIPSVATSVSRRGAPSSIRSSEPSEVARNKIAELELRLKLERVRELELRLQREKELEAQKSLSLARITAEQTGAKAGVKSGAK